MIELHKNQFDHIGHLLKIHFVSQVKRVNYGRWTRVWFTSDDRLKIMIKFFVSFKLIQIKYIKIF